MFGFLREWGDVPLVCLRGVLAAIFFVHGWPKMVNGREFAERNAGKPQLAGFMTFLGVAEMAGALALLAGFLAQLAALGLALIMLGAVGMKVGSKRGFAPKSASGTGWSYDAIIFAALLPILFGGPGRLAVDALIFRQP